MKGDLMKPIFIELTNAISEEKQALNLNHITSIARKSKGCIICMIDDTVLVEESYETIKNRIIEMGKVLNEGV
jgi:hypothetical protein